LLPLANTSAELANKWYIHDTFHASCKLRVIVNDFLPLYYSDNEKEDLDSTHVLDVATDIYRRLLEWRELLAGGLAIANDSPPHVLCMQ